MTSEQDFHYNFTAHTGVFYFKVAPMHSECGDYGCVNSTTPFIIIRKQKEISYARLYYLKIFSC